MSRRVFLHIGLPKSGTTYVQAVLGKNKERLAQDARLLYPGDRWADQVDAVRDVRRLRLPRPQRRAVAGAWDRLVAEMARWSGDSVVSMEWLCMATAAQARRVVRDLGPAEVHVVFTVRDLGRTVPAAWQEFTQNGYVWRWPEFLEQVSASDPMAGEAGRTFWEQQDMELLLDRWGSVVPAGRVHVVTVPQSGVDPTELWRRMAQVLGIEPSGYDLTNLGRNASLGMESAELMRRVNVRLQDEQLSLPAYNRVFKHRIAKRILASRKGDESRVVLPPALHDWARARAEQQVRAISASGARVVGDLEELRPVLRGAGGPAGGAVGSGVGCEVGAGAAEPGAEAVLDAAVDALVSVALNQRRRRSRRRGRRGRGAGRGSGSGGRRSADRVGTPRSARVVAWLRGRVAQLRPRHRPRG